MNGFSCFMLIFAGSLLLFGFYMYRGHDVSFLTWKAAFKGATKEDLKNVGKWVMIVSIIPVILAIIGLFFGIS